MDFPLNPKQIDELTANIQKRLTIATRKREIIERKLEECKKKNLPLPPEVCDARPLDEVNKEEKECRRALVKLELAAQINGWKTGDKVLCYTSGWRQRDMESGFEPLDYRLTMDKLDDRDNYYDRFHVVELEIMDRREDGKILAKSVHGKTLFMGVPLNDTKPILFFKVVK